MGLVSSLRANAVDVAGKWAAAGFLVYLASVFFIEGSRQKSIFYMLVALPSLLLCVRFRSLFRANSWSLVSVLAFLVYFSLSSLWSGEAAEMLEDAIKFSLSILCLMFGIEAVSSRMSPASMVRFIVCVGAAAAFFYTIMTLLEGSGMSALLADRSSLKDLSGWGTDNPISSAIYLGLPIVAAWWIFPSKSRHVQLGLILLMSISMMLMFYTKSRGPMLALFATLLLLALCRRSRTDVLLLVAGGAAALAIMLTTDIQSIALQRAAEPNYRMGIWFQALEQIRQHWAFGQGFGHDAGIHVKSDIYVTHAHSSVLEVFRVGGLIGGGLFLSMLFLLARNSISHRGGVFFLLWLLYGLLCLSTNGRMLLNRPSIEWFCFWIPLFLLYFSTRYVTTEVASEERSV